jgi:hypothetical protein
MVMIFIFRKKNFEDLTKTAKMSQSSAQRPGVETALNVKVTYVGLV